MTETKRMPVSMANVAVSPVTALSVAQTMTKNTPSPKLVTPLTMLATKAVMGAAKANILVHTTLAWGEEVCRWTLK